MWVRWPVRSSGCSGEASSASASRAWDRPSSRADSTETAPSSSSKQYCARLPSLEPVAQRLDCGAGLDDIHEKKRRVTNLEQLQLPVPNKKHANMWEPMLVLPADYVAG